MLNRTTITGRLTADPELRTTPNGTSVTSFSIANQRNYKNASGERDTDFFNIVAWRNAAELVTKYFKKGSLITIDGRLETRKFTDKQGNNRTITEIVADNVYFGNSKGDSDNTFENKKESVKNTSQTSPADFMPDFGNNQVERNGVLDDDGDLPF